MFILKKIFTKSSFFSLAISISLGLPISHAMEQDPDQKNLAGNNSTASKKMGKFQIDRVLSEVDQSQMDVSLVRASKIKALSEEKELLELSSFFNSKGYDLKTFFTEVEQAANLDKTLTPLQLRTAKIQALRDEKEFLELTDFFIAMGYDLKSSISDIEQAINLSGSMTPLQLKTFKCKMLRKEKELRELKSFFISIGYDIKTLFAEVNQAYGQTTNQDKLMQHRFTAMYEEKELLELSSFFIIEELKIELMPVIMIFNSFSIQQGLPCDIKNIIVQKLLFSRLGSRFICPPKK